MNTQKLIKQSKHNKTQKNNKITKKNGWILISIKGSPYERGFQHGETLSNELLEIHDMFPKFVRKEMEFSLNTYMEKCKKLIPIIKTDCSEIYEEIQGIVDGYNSINNNKKIKPITLEFIVAWNSMVSIWKSHLTKSNKKIKRNKKSQERCSIFIATGSYTENGEIVMAHNTHTDFITGKYCNIIMRVYPDKGHSFVMQTSPGLVWSLTDWFITDTGIIGCESTISDLNYDPKFGLPIFCRIRKIMQYARTLDECADILKTDSAGDYACSWLLGNIKTNEIMLYEEGLKYHNVQKTRDGVFYAANSAINPIIRIKETTDKSFFDPNTSSGSRMLRLGKLLTIDYFGKLNIDSAKSIIADHYDMGLSKEILNNNSICNHNETLKKYAIPFGAVDGKVTTSALARKGEFYGRWGSSCGRTFNAKRFLKQTPKYKKWGLEYLPDFQKQPWVKISVL
jgi:hypothetical protein